MTTTQLIESAIKKIKEGFPTQYIKVDGKVIRVSDHGANPDRVDNDTLSLVVGNSNQSYRSDRGRVITLWERANQWYVNSDGEFYEQFDSIDSFLEYNEVN